MNNNNTCTYRHCANHAAYSFTYDAIQSKKPKKEKLIKLCFEHYWKCVSEKLDHDKKLITTLIKNEKGRPCSRPLTKRYLYTYKPVNKQNNRDGDPKRRKSRK